MNALHCGEHPFLCLRHQTIELRVVQAKRMLPEARVLPYYVPVRHPVELLPSRAFEHDEERIQGDFLVLLAQPRLQLFGKECVHHLEIAIPYAQLKVERNNSCSRSIMTSRIRMRPL